MKILLALLITLNGLCAWGEPVQATGCWASHVHPWIQLYTKTVKGRKGPMASIKALDSLLDDYRTGTPLSAADEAHNRRLKRLILHGTFDIRELSRVAMGKHWGERSTTEQDHMVDLMMSLLEEKAILSKEQGKRKSGSAEVYRIQYLSEKFLDQDKQRARVKTRVHVPSYNVKIDLSYKLRKVGQVWKIVDVIVDDSSLVENYAYQFDAIIQKHGFTELIARMEKKLGELRGSETTESVEHG